MAAMADLMGRLQQEDPEIWEILRTFAEVDRLYREAILVANSPETTPAVRNSAEVLISFQSTPSDSSTGA